MTKILMLTDLHGNYSKMPEFLAQEPDFFLIAGDLTNMGPCEPAIDMLGGFNAPVFAVPGNCDKREMVNMIEESDAVGLHGASMILGKITITGIGGSNPGPFGTPFELTEDQIETIITAAEDVTPKNVHNILLCHAPPYDTLDEVGGGMKVGSTALRAHMKNYDLVCCGHIHEQIGVKTIDGTIVVNPGMAAEGKCALITLGDETGDIKVELLSL